MQRNTPEVLKTDSATLALQVLTITECFICVLALAAFWHVSPPIRDRYVALMIVPIVFAIVRYMFVRRLFTFHPIFVLIAFFFVLTLFNYQNAPFHRENYLVVVCRPWVGAWLIICALEVMRVFQRVTPLLWAVVLLGLLVGVLGLTSTQWDVKSDSLQFITDVLPKMSVKLVFPDAQLSFNPNEIAGAMAWLCPLLAGLTLLPMPRGGGRTLRIWAAVGASVLLLALVLGQSRAALFGVLGALLLLALLGLRGTPRRVAIGIVIVGICAQVALVRFVPDAPTPTLTEVPIVGGLNARDVSSVNTRLQMWQRSLEMVRDYPLTGVGMAMYRQAIRLPQYQIPYFEQINFTAPHSHNEWLQILVDLGIGGLLWLMGMVIVLGMSLGRMARSGDAFSTALALALTVGFIAHTGYSLGDAITLWDRFAFVWWCLIALTCAGTKIPLFGYNEQSEKTSAA